MSDKHRKAKTKPKQKCKKEQDEGITPDFAAVFGRQLKWQIQLASLDDVVVIHCTHISHVKGSVRVEKGVQSTADPLTSAALARAPRG
jgi:hypothetical protein